jgi:glycosyltransferase involved in cell wall biosynthesis
VSGRVADVEMDGLEALVRESAGADLLYVLLRERGRPVGRLVLERPRALDGAALHRLAEEATAPARAAGEEQAAALPADRLSVVVATRDRPESLSRTLAALRRLSPPPGELLVADSGSRDAAAVAETARRHGARCVRLDRPGLSLARNAGAAAATGEAIAFLDDDCLADPGWVGALCRGFGDPAVDVVTGQLLPAELETDAQLLFLRYAHMDRRGFVPARFSAAHPPSKHWPLDAWRMGSGGNLAVRKRAFARFGGFREDLGLGTPARGGEDLFLLWQAIRSGSTVVYRPDALAWHAHHRTREALENVLFGYGVGHAAYLRVVRGAGAPSASVARYRAMVLWDRGKRYARALLARDAAVRRLVAREMAGMRSGDVTPRDARTP